MTNVDILANEISAALFYYAATPANQKKLEASPHPVTYSYKDRVRQVAEQVAALNNTADDKALEDAIITGFVGWTPSHPTDPLDYMEHHYWNQEWAEVDHLGFAPVIIRRLRETGILNTL